MLTVTWVNKNGQPDFQECRDGEDVSKCILKVVIPGGGVRSSIRIHKVSETFELDSSIELVKGSECVPNSFMLR